MDLSLCIPIYNRDVNKLIQGLQKQCLSLNLNTEILAFDDFSNQEIRSLNIPLKDMKLVNYQEMETNLGRSVIRNRLARESRGEYIIFLDCDSDIISPDFISDYWVHRNSAVVIGGREYPENPPKGCTLHWKYGTHREVKNAEARNQRPYSNFHSNNFMILKSAFEKVRFNEKLKQYGHEDTFFGFELEQKGIEIKHITNHVLHAELESNQEFLEKSEKGVLNLIILNKLNPSFYQKSEILQLYNTIDKWKVRWFLNVIFKVFRSRWTSNLLSDNPSLRVFNWYKLCYLAYSGDQKIF